MTATNPSNVVTTEYPADAAPAADTLDVRLNGHTQPSHEDRLAQVRAKLEAADEQAAEEDKPKEADPAVAEKFAAAFKREKRAREQSERAKAELEQAQTMKAEIAQMKADLAAQMAEAKAEKERWQQLRSKPSAEILEQLGMDPREMAHGLINDGQPSAETMFKRVKEDLDATRDELRAYKEAQEKREAEARDAALKQSNESAVTQAKAGFAEFVEKDPSKYPYLLAVFTREQIADLAWDTGIEHVNAMRKRHGSNWEAPADFDEFIATTLDEYAKLEHQKYEERRTRYLAAPPAASTANGKDSNGKGSSTVLTNQLASDSATPARELTREERKKIAAKNLRLRE